MTHVCVTHDKFITKFVTECNFFLFFFLTNLGRKIVLKCKSWPARVHYLAMLGIRQSGKCHIERMASLGIMGDRLMANLIPLGTIVCCDVRMGI